MSKFVTNRLYLGNSLKISKYLQKKTKLKFYFFQSNRINTVSFFSKNIILFKRIMYLLYTIIEDQKKNVIGLLYVRLLRLIVDSLAASRMRIEVLGIGFNIIQHKNNLCFNVGTTDTISWNIPDNIFYKILGRKQNQLKIYTVSKQYLSDLLSFIIKLRTPNIYTGKGIYYYKLKFKTKIGKIKKI